MAHILACYIYTIWVHSKVVKIFTRSYNNIHINLRGIKTPLHLILAKPPITLIVASSTERPSNFPLLTLGSEIEWRNISIFHNNARKRRDTNINIRYPTHTPYFVSHLLPTSHLISFLIWPTDSLSRDWFGKYRLYLWGFGGSCFNKSHSWMIILRDWHLLKLEVSARSLPSRHVYTFHQNTSFSVPPSPRDGGLVFLHFVRYRSL